MAVPPPALGGFAFDDPRRFYCITATLVVLLGLAMANLLRSRFGRALVAIRDSDVAAEAMGIHLARYKTLAFGISAAYTGVAGSLFAHFLGYIGPDHFSVLLSIEYLAMIVLEGGARSWARCWARPPSRCCPRRSGRPSTCCAR